MSAAEELLNAHFCFHKVEPVREYRFGAEAAGGPGKGLRDRLARAGLKDWRFDFAFPEQKLAVEVEGGAWAGGRHTTGVGFSEDLKKYDAAMRLGWTVYRCDPGMVRSGRAIETALMLLKLSEGEPV
ncbi:hypothetical protein [Pseudomonas guariconensis]|uniref:hypothetical protein n=1 Tax=Pseudomonas guariconensis TaxID=1288410 RepID=UPI00390655E4